MGGAAKRAGRRTIRDRLLDNSPMFDTLKPPGTRLHARQGGLLILFSDAAPRRKEPGGRGRAGMTASLGWAEGAVPAEGSWNQFRRPGEGRGQLLASKILPQRVQVTRSLPFPRGTRRRWAHWGQIRYLYCLISAQVGFFRALRARWDLGAPAEEAGPPRKRLRKKVVTAVSAVRYFMFSR